MIVIGSQALSYYVEGSIKANDLDLVGSYDEVEALRKMWKPRSFYPINDGNTIVMKLQCGLIVEVEITWPGSRAEKLANFLDETNSWIAPGGFCEGWRVPELDVLYLLKMSHRYLKNSPHFLKTMRSIQAMREMGCKIQPEHQAFYEERMKDTYTYAHPKLDVKKDEFFDGNMTGVWQVYDHDSIHLAVAHMARPAYTYFKPEDSEVLCSKEMFFKCPKAVRLFAVLEESYVLALERSLVPFPGKKTPDEAFLFALMKVCTSITSGWFREYAWEHYDEVVALHDDLQADACYTTMFQKGLDSGIVKCLQ